MRDDVPVYRYFRDYKREIDGRTGTALVIFLPALISKGDPKAFDFLFGGPLRNEKFPDLKRIDLPCLWLTDQNGGHALLHLPPSQEESKFLIAALADEAPNASSARDLVRRVRKLRPDVTKKSQQSTAFAFGAVFVVAMLVLAIAFPNPTPFQYTVFRIVLALAIAGVAAMIPGFLEVEISGRIRAGGALAFFVIVYFYNPAKFVTPPSDVHRAQGYTRDALSFSPLSGVAVSMPRSSHVPVTSNNDGYFLFDEPGVSAGTAVEITAKLAGYDDYRQTLTAGEKPFDLLLKRSAIVIKRPRVQSTAGTKKRYTAPVKPLVVDAAGTGLDRTGSTPNLRTDSDMGVSNADPTCRSPFRAVYSFTAPKAGTYSLNIEYASGEARPMDVAVNGSPFRSGILEKPTLLGHEGFTNFGSYLLSGVPLRDGENRLEFSRNASGGAHAGSCTPFIKEFTLTLEP
jgi:hypothetical protein